MNEANPTFFIIIGTSILVLMSFSVILFVAFYQRKQLELEVQQQKELQEMEKQMQRKMLENSLEVQEIERRRIAKNLHDEVGAILSVTKMGFNELSKKLKDQPELEIQANNTRGLLEESINMVRSISKDLVPQTLENFGLVPAIEEFIGKVQQVSGLKTSFLFSGLSERERFRPNIELTLFRVMQELTNNTIKHAEAGEIIIELHFDKKNLHLTFRDNGKGFDYVSKMNDPKLGLGLRNIQSRLTVVNAGLDILSRPGAGTETKINIADPK